MNVKNEYAVAIGEFKQIYNLLRGVPYYPQQRDYKHLDNIRKRGYDGEWKWLFVKYLHWAEQDKWFRDNNVPADIPKLDQNLQKVMEYSKSTTGDRPYR